MTSAVSPVPASGAPGSLLPALRAIFEALRKPLASENGSLRLSSGREAMEKLGHAARHRGQHVLTRSSRHRGRKTLVRHDMLPGRAATDYGSQTPTTGGWELREKKVATDRRASGSWRSVLGIASKDSGSDHWPPADIGLVSSC